MAAEQAGPFPAQRALAFGRMFVIVAVDAEEFPITAVGRVVVVIDVLVMHGQFAQAFALELTTAVCADCLLYTSDAADE